MLGPVGTWATITLGPAATVAWGLGWPVVAGAFATIAARWTSGRGYVS